MWLFFQNRSFKIFLSNKLHECHLKLLYSGYCLFSSHFNCKFVHFRFKNGLLFSFIILLKMVCGQKEKSATVCLKTLKRLFFPQILDCMVQGSISSFMVSLEIHFAYFKETCYKFGWSKQGSFFLVVLSFQICNIHLEEEYLLQCNKFMYIQRFVLCSFVIDIPGLPLSHS